MKLKLSIIALLLTTTLAAQQRRIVRAGGAGGEDPAKDWPKVTAQATPAEAPAAIRAYVESLVQRDLFSGTVLVAKDGQPLFFESFGLASKEFNVANANDTKYNIGSINKVFTQVALMQLRDAGKIDFAKTLRTYLPDYASDVADKVTIQQLLQHTSGLGDIFGPEYAATPKDQLRTLSDYVPLFVKKPLEFEPGAGNRYSNAGYILLGLVIEKLSGQTYDDYVRTHIFTPLAMNGTAAYESDAVVPKRAVNYTRRDGTLRTNIHMRPGRGSSAGGGYSTVPDLLRFTRDAAKVLTPESFGRLIGNNPGVGWAGGSPGVNGVIEMEGPYTVIVLSNYDPPAAEEVAKNLRKLMGMAEG
jgi:CubicO group peptidase (beta-lactamase class C family)